MSTSRLALQRATSWVRRIESTARVLRERRDPETRRVEVIAEHARAWLIRAYQHPGRERMAAVAMIGAAAARVDLIRLAVLARGG